MSFRLDFLSNTTDTSSSNTTEFYGAESVVHWVFSGTTYVFVAGRSDDGVQVFSLGQDGSLTTAFDIDATDDSGYPLDFAADLWTASIGGVDLLFVAAANDDTVSVFQIGSGGTLTLVDKVSDTDDVSYFMDFDADNVLHSGISVGMAGQYTFMFTPGNADGGVSVFQVGAGGTLTNVENEASVGANLSGAAQTLPVEINGNTFLVVGTDGNNGLTVFSVSSAGALAQVDRFDDDATSQLDGVSGLAHAAVGGTDYIFATGYIDQGVSVFEISSAGALTNIFNLPDDASLSIGQAANLHVQKIGGDTYLFVAGHLDDAISVFAVSGDGTLTEVATITDPSDFISSNDIDVDLIEDRFFAVSVGGSGVGRTNVMALHNDTALGIYDTFIELDNVSNFLNGAEEVATAQVGTHTVVVTGSRIDSAISVFSVDATSVTGNTDNVADNATLFLSDLSDLETFVDGGTAYVVASGRVDNGFSIFSIDSGGTLTNTENVDDNGTFLLGGIRGLTTVELAGTTFLLTAGGFDDGVSVFALASGAVSANTDNVADSGALEINGAWAVETAEISGTTYVFVAGRDDAGISVFSISNLGVLTNVFNFDATGASQPFHQPETLVATDVNGTTYLYAGVHLLQDANLVGGIAVFEVSSGGALTMVQRIYDDGNLNLSDTEDLRIIDVGGVQHLVVVGDDPDGGLSFFAIDDGGRLSNAANIEDGGARQLLGVSGIASAVVGGSTQVYAVSRFDVSLSAFTVSNSAQLALLNVDTEVDSDNGFYNLLAANGAELVTVGGNSFAISSGTGALGGLTSLAVDASGALSYAHHLNDSASMSLGGIRKVHAFEAGGTQFVAAGTLSEGFGIVSVNASGQFSYVDTETLSGSTVNSFASIDIGGTTYLFANETGTDVVAMYSVSAAGDATFIASVSDDATLNINNPAALLAFEAGGNAYLMAGSGFDDGISVFRIEPTGVPSHLVPVFDLNDVTDLASPSASATATINGNVFVFIGSTVNDRVLSYRANDDGSLDRIDAIVDATSDLLLDGPNQLRAVEIGGVHYLLVGAGTSDTAHVFRIRDDGSLSHVDSVADNGTIALDSITGIDAGYADGVPVMIVSGSADDGISSFLLNTPPVEWSRSGERLGAFEGLQKVLDRALDNDAITVNPDYHLGETSLSVLHDGAVVNAGANGGFAFSLADTISTFTLFGTGSANATVSNTAGTTVNGSDGANALVGSSGNDTLIGNGGGDTIDGLGGADNMVGGPGDDIFVVDDAGDTVSDGVGEGTDQVNSSVGFTLFANLEHLSLLGSANINGIGNELDNNIFGNAGNNTLDGLTGADNMVGGEGDDIYVVDNVGDSVSDSPGVSGGTDQVNSYVGFTLFSFLENLSLLGTANIDAIGNSENNILIGNSGNNTLDGLGGADTMIGNEGDDIFVVDNIADTVADLASGGGTDQVNSSVSFALVDHIENLSLLGSGNINAIGNTLANVLIGNSGNNTLDGLGGADTMVGNGGDDIYVVDNVGDIVSESPGGGTDQVNSSVSFVLFSNIEHLSLLGSADINATGNELANNLFGNSGNNLFIGNAGNDLMVGNGGNDTYLFGDGCEDDIITDFSAGAGAGDVLNIAAFGFADFAAVQAATTDTAGGALIQLDADDSVTLQGVLKADLAGDDFVLV